MGLGCSWCQVEEGNNIKYDDNKKDKTNVIFDVKKWKKMKN